MNIMHSQKNTSLNINIDNYSGPLEVLLDLAKSQKVNLEKTVEIKKYFLLVIFGLML